MQGLWGRKGKGEWRNYIILSKSKRNNHKKELQDPGLNPKIFLNQHLVLNDSRAKEHGTCIYMAIGKK